MQVPVSVVRFQKQHLSERKWRDANTEFAFATVVTKFKLKAYRFTQSIFAGPIIIPRRQLSAVAKGVDRMNARPTVPQVSLDLAVLRKEAMAHVGATEDLLVVQAFDALGEEHGRSEEGFKWALEIPDAKAMTKVTNLRGVALMAGRLPHFWFLGSIARLRCCYGSSVTDVISLIQTTTNPSKVGPNAFGLHQQSTL